MAITKGPHDKLPFVMVTWWDACEFQGGAALVDAAREHKPVLVTTVGWLLVDDEVGVQLANEFYEDRYRGRTLVLRSMIKEVIPFQLTKSRTLKEGSVDGQRGIRTTRIEDSTRRPEKAGDTRP